MATSTRLIFLKSYFVFSLELLQVYISGKTGKSRKNIRCVYTDNKAMELNISKKSALL